MKKLFFFAITLVILALAWHSIRVFADHSNNSETTVIASTEVIEVGKVKELLHKPEITQPYNPMPLNISGVKLPGSSGQFGLLGSRQDVLDGAIMRALRYKNIADYVEDRYGLPRGLLTAMIAKESHGMQLLPNGRNDGGFGLIHMQPSVAQRFNLKVYGNSKKEIDKTHGEALHSEIKRKRYVIEDLYHLDDRLDMVLNIDAAGRILALYYYGKPAKGRDRFGSAMIRFAGRHNGNKYQKDIERYMSLINDDKYIKKLSDRFSIESPYAKVNGVSVNFTGYIKAFHEQNLDFGLREYASLPRLNIAKTTQSPW